MAGYIALILRKLSVRLFGAPSASELVDIGAHRDAYRGVSEGPWKEKRRAQLVGVERDGPAVQDNAISALLDDRSGATALSPSAPPAFRMGAHSCSYRSLHV